MIITRNGITIRMALKSIREVGRSTQGVTVIHLQAGDTSGSIERIANIWDREYTDELACLPHFDMSVASLIMALSPLATALLAHCTRKPCLIERSAVQDRLAAAELPLFAAVVELQCSYGGYLIPPEPFSYEVGVVTSARDPLLAVRDTIYRDSVWHFECLDFHCAAPIAVYVDQFGGLNCDGDPVHESMDKLIELEAIRWSYGTSFGWKSVLTARVEPRDIRIAQLLHLTGIDEASDRYSMVGSTDDIVLIQSKEWGGADTDGISISVRNNEGYKQVADALAGLRRSEPDVESQITYSVFPS